MNECEIEPSASTCQDLTHGIGSWLDLIKRLFMHGQRKESKDHLV